MDTQQYYGDITGALCVFYSNSPFSDFFASTFVIEGISFSSVEHYFQIQMLRSFGLFKLAMKLSTIFDANTFRRLLRRNLKILVQNGLFDERIFDSWRATNALRLLRKANRAKFEQNFDLKRQLLATGDRILVFTNRHDRLFGVGMDEMTFLDWVSQQNWTIEDMLDYFSKGDMLDDSAVGKNILGLVLMEIRGELSCSVSPLIAWKQQTTEIQNENVATGTADQQENNSTIYEVQDSLFFDPVSNNVQEGTDNAVTDEQILTNLASAEEALSQANNDNDNDNDGPSTSSSIAFRVPNERRIIYRKPGFVQRVIGAANTNDSKQQEEINTINGSSETIGQCNEGQENTIYNNLDQRKAVLDRLKALKFEKPMINPFSFENNESGRYPFEALSNSTNPLDVDETRRKIPRLCDLPPAQFPIRTERYVVDYPQLEPGEIPSTDYQPRLMSAGFSNNYGSQHSMVAEHVQHPMNGTGHFQDPSALEQWSSIAYPMVDLTQTSTQDDTDNLWIPSSNPMKEVFESAKAGITKLVKSVKKAKEQDQDISNVMPFRLPPLQAHAEAKKRKRRAKPTPTYAKIFYNSKDAQSRHLANRWVKGGRLTTTGEFEECHSDESDDDSTSKTVDHTLRQLEAVPESMDDQIGEKPRPVQLHIVYEDTSDYADYVKWYSSVHGHRPSDVVDDEYQQYLREWYRWYKTAVKFVDVEPLSDDGEPNDEVCTAGDGAIDNPDMSNDDKAKMLLHQWRWQQINEWQLKKATSASSATHETHSDGISYSGKPVAYSNCPDNA